MPRRSGEQHREAPRPTQGSAASSSVPPSIGSPRPRLLRALAARGSGATKALGVVQARTRRSGLGFQQVACASGDAPDVRLNGIEDRVALVTGAGQGIGRCIAETLRDLGAKTAAGDLQPPALVGVLGVALDVSDEHSVDQAFGAVERELGAVELLVLNAGIMVSQPFREVTVEVWSRQLEVNLTGAFLCARRALPAMADAGFGSIVAVGSSAGKTGGGVAAAAYSASKAGLMTLSKSIAKEYARHGIRSNA